jgi:hypothetical protein
MRSIGASMQLASADPDRGKWNQNSVSSGELARHYGFTDIDGSRPDIWCYTAEVREGGKVADISEYR